MFNDDMESGDSFTINEPTVTTYDASVFKTGSKALKINNSTTTEKVIHSDKWIPINNAVATEYTYSGWVYTNTPQAELLLFMKTDTETGYYSQIDYIRTASNIPLNQWTYIEKTVSVPASIKKLNLRLDNNGFGTVWFDDIRIKQKSNVANPLRELNITYNAFKSPVQIEETGVDKISFFYNDANNRSSMFYGGLQDDKLLRPMRKHYSIDGSTEIKYNTQTNEVEFITYIGGDGYTAPVVLRSNGTTQDYLYLHRDYQGTILAISNAQGAVVEKRLFDAWGQLLKVEDCKGNVLSKMMVLDRGYTGHEHLQSVGLVHMNGRLYDAKLHRFLQPDNFVQDPYNTQNFNRYGYVLNNPLKYTDPTGEFTWSDLFAAVAIVVGAALVIFSAGTLATLGGALIVSGFTHFASTYNEYKQTGNWDAASINAGVMFGIQLETDWGYNKPKNGIGQQDSNSINNPKPDTNTNTNTGTQNGGNGVQVFVESDGVGHTYISANNTVFSYGRYNGSYSPSSGQFGPIGEGVLYKKTGKQAQEFIDKRMADYPTLVYNINTNSNKVYDYLDKQYNTGKYNTKDSRVIDAYTLIGNNCTTKVCNGLRAGGYDISIQTPAGFIEHMNTLKKMKNGYIPGRYLEYDSKW